MLLATAVLLRAAMGSEGAALEDAVKATFVVKFAPFVTWPPATPDSTFDICSAGQDGVTSLLPQVTAGQRIDGHPVVLRTVTDAGGLNGCRIMYVASSGPVAMLEAARGRPILTITQEPRSGHGIIQLVTAQHHVRFDVDLTLASQGGIVISSKLLSLARVVVPARKEPG